MGEYGQIASGAIKLSRFKIWAAKIASSEVKIFQLGKNQVMTGRGDKISAADKTASAAKTTRKKSVIQRRDNR